MPPLPVFLHGLAMMIGFVAIAIIILCPVAIGLGWLLAVVFRSDTDDWVDLWMRGILALLVIALLFCMGMLGANIIGY